MATRYAIRHKTTGELLQFRPDIGPIAYVADEQDACSLSTKKEAELLLLHLEDFAGAHEVVLVEVRMNVDKFPGAGCVGPER
jgi:hypothetical protein